MSPKFPCVVTPRIWELFRSTFFWKAKWHNLVQVECLSVWWLTFVLLQVDAMLVGAGVEFENTGTF